MRCEPARGESQQLDLQLHFEQNYDMEHNAFCSSADNYWTDLKHRFAL